MNCRAIAPVILVASLALIGFVARSQGAEETPAAKPKVEKIDVDQFDKKRQESGSVVLDVRTPVEYAAGHVPGAVNLDIHDPKFDEKLAALDKSKTYLVHCAHGYRSGLASSKMATMGFTNLFDFHDGFTGWQNAHKPIEKGNNTGDAGK